MNTKKLKQLVLDLAIHGKLVPQDPNDEPASELLARIRVGSFAHDKDDELFCIPNSWVWTKLGNIGEISRGKGFVKSDFVEKGCPCIHYGQIHMKFGLSTKEVLSYIPEEIARKSGVAHPNDVIIAITSEDELCSCKSTAWLGMTDVAVGAHAAIFHHNINPMYVSYYLASKCFYNQKIQYTHGSKVVEIRASDIGLCNIPLPPLSEQRRIVAEIERWFGVIDQLESNEADLKKSIEQTKKKVLDLAIRGKLVKQEKGDEPARELLARIRAEKAETQGRASKGKKTAIPSVELDEVPFEVPKGWEWTLLPCIAEDDLGKTLDREKNKGVFYPYLRSANVLRGQFDFSDLKEMKFEDSELNFYSLQKGDLLVCEGGDIGRSSVWNDDRKMYFQNALHRLRFHGGINPYLFMYFLHYYKDSNFLDEYSQGVTIKHLTKSSLSKIPFPVPPLEEQRRIVERVEEVFGVLGRIEEVR